MTLYIPLQAHDTHADTHAHTLVRTVTRHAHAGVVTLQLGEVIVQVALAPSVQEALAHLRGDVVIPAGEGGPAGSDFAGDETVPCKRHRCLT